MFYNSRVIFLSVPGLFHLAHCLSSPLRMYKLKHIKNQKNMGLDRRLPIKILTLQARGPELTPKPMKMPRAGLHACNSSARETETGGLLTVADLRVYLKW